ncbi:unnamed protein product [Camellia sinensis]
MEIVESDDGSVSMSGDVAMGCVAVALEQLWFWVGFFVMIRNTQMVCFTTSGAHIEVLVRSHNAKQFTKLRCYNARMTCVVIRYMTGLIIEGLEFQFL